jgi:predicted O-linked N-acetylglucosamine transferase (SPINDLY family)
MNLPPQNNPFERALKMHQAGRFAEAERLYRKVISKHPGDWRAHYNLASVLSAQGRLDEAISAYRQTVRLNPSLADVQSDLGNALRNKGEVDAAIECYLRALKLAPNHVYALNGLGVSLIDKGDRPGAGAAFERVIQIQPDFASTHNNLGKLRHEAGDMDGAMESFRRAIALQPNAGEVYCSLGNVLKDVGQVDQALAHYAKAMALSPQFLSSHANRIWLLHFQPGQDAKAILREQRRWNDAIAKPLGGRIVAHDNDRSPQRRLRIGYVSGDFRDHVVGRNILPLVREHDRQAVEVFCYSNVERRDEFTARYRALADHWRDIRALSEEQAAELIRRDKIDILVDLSLHLADNRLLVFARKPAPVQVTFAGYPGGTGLDTIDYRLTDPWLDPPGEHDDDYAERSIRLPESFWCYDPDAMQVTDAPEPGPPPAARNGYVTFGCLNNFCKVSDGALDLWVRILKRVPGSRLLLMAPPGSARDRVAARLAPGGEAGGGVEAGRIRYVAYQPRPAYLQTNAEIDIVLDTVPYNGHTTSLDALWMGAPVITLVGRTVVGRAGLSQLRNLNLTDLIATTPQQFV